MSLGETVNEAWGVAPRQRLYYCEKCKIYVLPLDVDERFELNAVVNEKTVRVTETITAKHRKCGSTLIEKFWGKE